MTTAVVPKAIKAFENKKHRPTAKNCRNVRVFFYFEFDR